MNAANDDGKSQTSKISNARDLMNQVDEQIAAENSSKGGSAAGVNRPVTNQSAMSGARSTNKPGTGGSNARPGGSRKFDRVLSSKAVQIGHEHGITAEFICKQSAEQTVFKLEHLFTLFDIFQSSLFANDPEIAKDNVS